jgi:hypothetical protein
MRRSLCFAVIAFGLVGAIAAPALACGGLIGPNGAVNLERTTTLSAFHNGVEHYITAFEYAGGGGEFGSIVPLPAMPSKVEKGGDWTLQRLRQETEPAQTASFVAGSADSEQAAKATVVYETKIDALEIKVVKGGGRSVGIWAAEHGFRLPPDAPEVLDFYAKRSPYFLTAVFDSQEAEKRRQNIGDGTPIHVTIPLRSPWVPLRILALGKQASERVEADVYLLTDRVPALLPSGNLAGYTVERQVPASDQLLADLRSDRGMEWLPKSGMTLTHLIVNAKAQTMRYDLAINAYGASPSRTRAGLPPLPTPEPPTPAPTVAPTPDPTATPIETVLAAPVKEDDSSVWSLSIAIVVTIVAASGAALVMRRRGRSTA